jgi:hypothetical protein
MKLFYTLLICVLLAGCGVSAEQPTATPTITATLTPQPNLTATERANRDATQTMRVNNSRATLTQAAVPTITAVAEAANALSEISDAASGIEGIDFSQAKLVFGPLNDSLMQKDDKYVEVFSAGLSLKNFVARITFINPYDTATVGNWDYGLFFRNKYNNDQYRLVILSNQTWTLIDHKSKKYVYTKTSKDLTTKKGEENTIWLIVVDETAHLFINGIYMQALDIPRLTNGDINPATGVYYGNTKSMKATEFRNFEVWSLP